MPHIIHETNVLQFSEDDANGSNKVNVRAASNLTSDVYIELPTTSGTLATQGYVSNSTGGTFLGLTEDFTQTAASTVDVTGLSFTVEANRSYIVEGVFAMADVAALSSGCISWSLPASATFIGYHTQPRPGSFAVTSNPWTETYNSSIGNEQAGEITNYDSNGLYAVPIFFTVVLNIGATAGTAKIQFTNRTGNATVQGIRKGSFIRVIDPQA